MRYLKYILFTYLLIDITFSIDNDHLSISSLSHLIACDPEDYDDDYDDSTFADWVDDEHAGNAEGYWDTADSFVCVGTTPDNNDDDNSLFGEEDDNASWWKDDIDPCENGDCDDFDTEVGTYDCAGVLNGTAYTDECNHCVGGTTGKKACIKDCMGVENGKAYFHECKGEQVCVNGNAGTFDIHLEGEVLNRFNNAIASMRNNCWTNTLLNELNDNYGINININASLNTQTPGAFNPCKYSISFATANSISSHELTAELFHAYQEQISGGRLSEIATSTTHIGGSNVEAEEKAMGIIANSWNGISGSFENSYNKLYTWTITYMYNHLTTHSCNLSEQEFTSWYEAVEEFAEISRSADAESGIHTLYGAPVDYELSPMGLINLCSNLPLGCEPVSEIVIRPNIGKGKRF